MNTIEENERRVDRTRSAPGVAPPFRIADPKAAAIEYAKGCFSGSAAGEIHVDCDGGVAIVETIQIDSHGQYC